jgi:hypothetical protein
MSDRLAIELSSINSPFVGLVPLTESDPLFERDTDAELLMSRFESGRVSVLFAGSGVGKSSFLNAKFIPTLKKMFTVENVLAPASWAREDPELVLRGIRKSMTERGEQSTTYVLILDQFEEVFQHFPNADLLRRVGTELSKIALGLRWNADETDGANDRENSANPASDYLSPLDIRLLISIREEFLAELSMFDDFLPGLFSNYYRLGKPTVPQAESIVQQTANLRDVKTNRRVELLLADLCKVEAYESKNADVVDLPYLQIVCEQVWLRERPTQGSEFLTSYRAGEAKEHLDAYCRRVLDALSIPEKRLLTKALGQLTGQYEAKRFARLAELGHELRVSNLDRLNNVLTKLSATDVRILRKWFETKPKMCPSGWRGEVFELYHDMYSPLLWNWRREQERLERLWLLAGTFALGIVLWFLVGSPVAEWLGVRKILHRPQGTADEIADLRDMRNAFSHSLVGHSLGDHVWREYHHKFATERALEGDTDGALLHRLAAIGVDAEFLSDSELLQILGPAQYLLATFKQSGSIFTDAVIVPPAGKSKTPGIMAGTQTGKILSWSGAGSSPEDLGVKFLPALSQDQSRRILCFSPDGQFVLVATAEAIPSTTSGPDARVTIANIRIDSGARLGELSVPLSVGVLKLTFDTNNRDVERNREVDVRRIALQNVFGAYSQDSQLIGLVLDNDFAKTALVSHQDLRHVVEIPLPGESVISIGFASCNSSSPVCDPHTVALITQVGSDLLKNSSVRLFSDRTGTLTRLLPNFWLPQKAGLVFNNEGQLLVRNASRANSWEWFSDKDEHHIPVVLPDRVAPVGFVDNEKQILLSKDDLGRLFFTNLNDSLSERLGTSTELAISEPIQPAPPFAGDSRSLTFASLNGNARDNEFLTIENGGVALRQWKVPPSQAWTAPTQQSFVLVGSESRQGDRSDSPVSEAGPTTFYSIDGAWKATLQASKVIVQGNLESNHSAEKWSIDLSGGNRPVSISVGVHGDRLLLWYRDFASYQRKGNNPTSILRFARERANDVVFGPGSERVTVVSSSTVSIYRDRQPESAGTVDSESTPEWAHQCNHCSLLHDADDSAVVLYSGVWVHRVSVPRPTVRVWDEITEWIHTEFDSFRTTSRPDRSDTTYQWPLIVSVMVPVNLSPFYGIKSHDINNNKIVEVAGPAGPEIDFDEEEKKQFSFEQTGRFGVSGVWEVGLCNAGAPEQHLTAHTNRHRVMCEWELRSGRQLGINVPNN